MAQVAHPRRGGPSRLGLVEVAALAVLAYVPFFLSSPGRLASDTKQYLYLDPGRFLARVPYLWDPHVAAGTVPHQQLGYLFPMGPYYWLFDRIGAPDWVAQRIWLGTISLAAVLGARWLFARLGLGRVAVLTAALVYMLTPYQLAFTARISVLLLPWAALPWIVGLTMRAAARGGWRDPAAIALIVLAIGGVNASTLVLAAVGPGLWIAIELLHGGERANAAAAAAARIAVLSLGTSLWWIAGLALQGSRGLPILQLTENVRTVSSASSPGDVLRGLGNWFFYGFDQAGHSLVQSQAYLTGRVVVLASYLVPALALVAGASVRWRHRTYFVACIVVGTLVGVGAWPYDHATPWGHLWKAFTGDTSVGLALRNAPRVVPVVVLGVAALIGAGVASLRMTTVRRIVALGVVTVVALAFLPVWRDGYLTPGVERPEAVPAYWRHAIAALDADSHATRVLEIPGSAFATYRWGNAVEPITPGLMDRDYLAREVLPAGTPESVNLLDALDRRIQNGSFEPAALAPVARLFGVGTVAVRNDLAYERSGTARPRLVWSSLTDPRPDGLGAPRDFGQGVENQAPTTDGIDLRTDPATASPPAVALFPVRDPVPIVRVLPDRDPVVLAGDGDGIVDSAAAGLVTGRERLVELAATDDAALTHALHTGAALVLTDSNRRRNASWFSSIRDTRGPTQEAGRSSADVNGYDAPVHLFADDSDAAHTVVETTGGTVTASADGGAARPEDRATAAFDGATDTQWRVGGNDPVGQWIRVQPDRAVRTDHVDLVQPVGLPRDRWVTRARVTVNGKRAIDVDLGDASFTSTGQRVSFPETAVRSLRIEITGVHEPTFDPQRANAVGFAEIRLGSLRVHETVRLPVDLARRVGGRAHGHAVAVVLSRLRQETGADGRTDEEPALRRRVLTPDTRTYDLTGTVRVDPNAPDATIDTVLGTGLADTRFTASSHLAGDPGVRASRGFTGAPGDTWVPAFGPQGGQWLERTGPPVTADHVTLQVHTDAHHSTPTRMTVVADGTPVGSVAVSVPAAAASGATATAVPVRFDFPATTASSWRILVDAAAPPPGTSPAPVAVLPVAIGAVTVPGLATPPAGGAITAACRDDLLRVDGTGVPVRLRGSAADARRGLALESCAGPLRLSAGSHRVVSPRGRAVGLDVDRVLLTSDRAGGPTDPAPLVPPTATAASHTSRPAPTAVRTRVRTDGAPFWLVLGESYSTGWDATGLHTGDLGAPSLVDGYANGWLVRPARAGPVSVSLDWTPQRFVWLALGATALAVLLCLGLVVGRRRRRPIPVLADRPVAWLGRDGPGLGLAPATVATAAVFGSGLVWSRPWIAVVAALVAAVSAKWPITRAPLGVGAAAVLLLSRIAHRPELAWLALFGFAGVVVTSTMADRAERTAPVSPPASG